MRRPASMSYARAVGQALSQLIHALIGGHPDVMTSAAAHSPEDRAERSFRGWMLRRLHPVLNWLDRGHTGRAWRQDRDEWR